MKKRNTEKNSLQINGVAAMEPARFINITVIYGRGKTQVFGTFEDLNYFCIDNLPVLLLPKFSELWRQSPAHNTAVVVDSRDGDTFERLVEITG